MRKGGVNKERSVRRGDCVETKIILGNLSSKGDGPFEKRSDKVQKRVYNGKVTPGNILMGQILTFEYGV